MSAPPRLEIKEDVSMRQSVLNYAGIGKLKRPVVYAAKIIYSHSRTESGEGNEKAIIHGASRRHRRDTYYFYSTSGGHLVLGCSPGDRSMSGLYRRLYSLPPDIRNIIELRYNGPIPEEAIAYGEDLVREREQEELGRRMAFDVRAPRRDHDAA
jgi:hypothetical protein